MPLTQQREELVYAGLTGERLVAMEADVHALIRRILEEWESSDGEDVAIWQSSNDGPNSLVAVIGADLFGNVRVTWLRKQPKPKPPVGPEEDENW